MKNKYIATYGITATMGIGIIDIEYGIDDYCICEMIGGKEARKTKNKIYTDNEGRSYIKKYNCKYYLDEFIKTNI